MRYSKVTALCFLIRSEDTFINICKKVLFDILNPRPFLLLQCVLLAGMRQPLLSLFIHFFCVRIRFK